MDSFDVVLVGSGFSSIFFLHKLLEKRPASKVLVLERGRHRSWEWQVRNRRNADPSFDEDRVIRRTGLAGQRWPHTIGLGGGSNCWGANAMRMHAMGFRLKSEHGVGVDWPIGYDALEPYYSEAETLMSIAGDDDSAALFPRSRPFPQPRHRFNDVARVLKNHYPDRFFAMPQARARVATRYRNPCCANNACAQCPSNAKFMILQDMPELLADKRVEIRLGAEVTALVAGGGRVTGVVYKDGGKSREVRGELVVLGANAIFNPFLLLKSGIDHGPVGLGLQEQPSVGATAYLGGSFDSANGSSPFAGVGYHYLVGEHLARGAGGFFEVGNGLLLRPDAKRWGSILTVTALFDDLRQDRNRVTVSRDDPDRPHVHFEDWSDYGKAGREHFRDTIGTLLAPFDVEWLHVAAPEHGGFAHIQGTTVMGKDAATSVVDGGMVHHTHRNLLVLGSGAFPTAGGVNPTLTLSALALRAADRL
ncbi:MAG: GMC family oxidoreductase [Sphingomonas sp.]